MFTFCLWRCCQHAALRCQVLFWNEILYPSYRWKLCVDPCAMRLAIVISDVDYCSYWFFYMFLLYRIYNSLFWTFFLSSLLFAVHSWCHLAFHTNILKYISEYVFFVLHILYAAFLLLFASLFTSMTFVFCIVSSAMSMTTSLAPRTYLRIQQLERTWWRFAYACVCAYACMFVWNLYRVE